jgi:hypothetical protein
MTDNNLGAACYNSCRDRAFETRFGYHPGTTLATSSRQEAESHLAGKRALVEMNQAGQPG